MFEKTKEQAPPLVPSATEATELEAQPDEFTVNRNEQLALQRKLRGQRVSGRHHQHHITRKR